MTWLDPIGARMTPGNFGPMKGAHANARIAGSCGDTMEFWLRLDGLRVLRATFTTDGCETSEAAGAVAAHLAEGRTMEEVCRIRPIDVLEVLGIADSEAGEEAHHCADLALETIRTALGRYEESLRAAKTASCSDA